MSDQRSNADGGIRINLKQLATIVGLLIALGSVFYKAYWFVFEVERNTGRVKELKEDVRALKQAYGEHKHAIDQRFAKAHRSIERELHELDRNVVTMRRVMDRLALLEVLRGGETPQLLAGKSRPVRAREVRREMHGLLNNMDVSEPAERKQPYMEEF